MPFKFDHAFYVWSIKADTQSLVVGMGEDGVLYTVAVGMGEELVPDESVHMIALCDCEGCAETTSKVQDLMRSEAKAIAIL